MLLSTPFREAGIKTKPSFFSAQEEFDWKERKLEDVGHSTRSLSMTLRIHKIQIQFPVVYF
jgi:hypothetical protein